MGISPIGLQPVLPTRSASAQPTAPAASTAPAPVPDTPAIQSVSVELPDLMPGHLQLDIDRASGQFVGRIVNKKTGAVISQVPSEEALRLAAAFKQDTAPIFRRKA